MPKAYATDEYGHGWIIDGPGACQMKQRHFRSIVNLIEKVARARIYISFQGPARNLSIMYRELLP